MKALVFLLLLIVPAAAYAADPQVMWTYKCVDGTQEFTGTFVHYPDKPAWCEYDIICWSSDRGQYYQEKSQPWVGEKLILLKCLKQYGFSRNQPKPKCYNESNWIRQ